MCCEEAQAYNGSFAMSGKLLVFTRFPDPLRLAVLFWQLTLATVFGVMTTKRQQLTIRYVIYSFVEYQHPIDTFCRNPCSKNRVQIQAKVLIALQASASGQFLTFFYSLQGLGHCKYDTGGGIH